MSKLDKEQVLEKFSAAYQNAHGKTPSIEAKGGWYSVDGGKNVRLAQLDEMADELSGGKTDVACEEKAAPVEANAPTKPTKKKASKQAKAASGFDVKAFWSAKLIKSDEANTLPR
jgi:hypothetical protein